MFVSGTSFIANFSRSEDIGSKSAVQAILNSECAIAIPRYDADASKSAGFKIADIRLNTESQIIVPITLNDKCTIAARFAFLFVPKDERSAVTQVPIFCPIIIGTAAP